MRDCLRFCLRKKTRIAAGKGQAFFARRKCGRAHGADDCRGKGTRLLRTKKARTVLEAKRARFAEADFARSAFTAERGSPDRCDRTPASLRTDVPRSGLLLRAAACDRFFGKSTVAERTPKPRELSSSASARTSETAVRPRAVAFEAMHRRALGQVAHQQMIARLHRHQVTRAAVTVRIERVVGRAESVIQQIDGRFARMAHADRKSVV